MLEKAGVAITPGLDFDSKRGKQTIRFSYARTTDEIKEGIKRIIEFMDKYKE
jgi:aspartate/methionine/tyrosine aminotransferase